jgi:hypothetical protein
MLSRLASRHCRPAPGCLPDRQAEKLRARPNVNVIAMSLRPMVGAMSKPAKAPRFEPRQLKDGSGWYVLVSWGDRPSEQTGSFATKVQAEEWVDETRDLWIKLQVERQEEET